MTDTARHIPMSHHARVLPVVAGMVAWLLAGLYPVLAGPSDTIPEPTGGLVRIEGLVVHETPPVAGLVVSQPRPRSLVTKVSRTIWTQEEDEALRRLEAIREMTGAMPLYYRVGSDRSVEFNDSETQGIWRNFIQAMGKKLTENRQWITMLRDAERMSGTDDWQRNQMALYKGEMRELAYIERDITANAISAAMADTFEKTPVGRTVKSIERAVIRYMTMEYRKTVHDESGRLYLPGEKLPEATRSETDYGVSLSALIHVDADSLSGDLAMKLVGTFHGTVANLMYDVSGGEASLTLESRELDEWLGSKAGLGFVYNEDDELIGLVTFSFDF